MANLRLSSVVKIYLGSIIRIGRASVKGAGRRSDGISSKLFPKTEQKLFLIDKYAGIR